VLALADGCKLKREGSMTAPCIWSNRADPGAREVAIGSNGPSGAGASYTVCPEHEPQLRRYKADVDRFSGLFLGLLGLFVLGLVFFTMLGSAVGVGISIVFLGIVLIRFPFATPQTVQIDGCACRDLAWTCDRCGARRSGHPADDHPSVTRSSNEDSSVSRWLSILMIVAAYALSVVVYPQLPEQVPIHWTLAGDVDGWADRWWGAFLLPTVMLVNWFVFVLPSSRGAERMVKSRRLYGLLVSGSTLVLFLLHATALRLALGGAPPIQAVAAIGLGLLFIALGAVLPHARPNWILGIRTPWTLRSARVWERTHRLGGFLYTGVGLLTVFVGFLLPSWSLYVTLIAFIGASAGMVAYSYGLWKGENGR
jgi:uncharacterized membrane protein